MPVGDVEKQLMEAETSLGLRFRDRSLLLLALTHSSFANEVQLRRPEHNERLEFLGDAVLELVVSAELYARYPKLREGELSRLRAQLVCERSLATCARALRLGDYLRLGRGEAATGGRERDSVLSDAFEAVIGALYLDGGLTQAQAFICAQLPLEVDMAPSREESKTRLQEWSQLNGFGQVEYQTEVIDGEPPQFRAIAAIGGKSYGEGQGTSKKAAQQAAAYHALVKLGMQ